MRWALVLLVLLLSAGCARPQDPFSPDAIAGSFPDADERFTNASRAEHEASYAFRVPDSAFRLVVKGHYRSADDGSFVLRTPNGNGARIDTFPQGKDHAAAEWYAVRDPAPGRWSLSAHLTHGGDYAFGIYLD